MHVTIEFDYDMPDSREARVADYGVADVEKCAEIDAEQDPLDLLGLVSPGVEIKVTIVRAAPTP